MNKEKVFEGVKEVYNGGIGQFWELVNKDQVHIGYWESPDDHSNIANAANKLTEKMIEKVKINEGERFIDIGCGVGVPGLKLVQKKKCHLIGVTLSDHQAAKANENAEKMGLSDMAHFQVANAIDLPFDDNSFDGGWFFESIFHMDQLPSLKEAYRVLKPGAQVVIADILFDDLKLYPEFNEFFLNAFSGPYCKAPDEYPIIVKNAGFRLLEYQDVTKNANFIRSSQEWIKEAQLRKNEVIQLTNEDFYNLLIESFNFLINCLIKAKTRYALITLEKEA